MEEELLFVGGDYNGQWNTVPHTRDVVVLHKMEMSYPALFSTDPLTKVENKLTKYVKRAIVYNGKRVYIMLCDGCDIDFNK